QAARKVVYSSVLLGEQPASKTGGQGSTPCAAASIPSPERSAPPRAAPPRQSSTADAPASSPSPSPHPSIGRCPPRQPDHRPQFHPSVAFPPPNANPAGATAANRRAHGSAFGSPPAPPGRTGAARSPVSR